MFALFGATHTERTPRAVRAAPRARCVGDSISRQHLAAPGILVITLTLAGAVNGEGRNSGQGRKPSISTN